MDWLPEYMQYWLAVGLSKFVRVFWFFVFFEATRYLGIDFIVLIHYAITRKKRREGFQKARLKLHAENPFISILVPGKNEGDHLYKLTKSLAEQTYKNFELIVVDDGSDDQTPLIGRNLERMGLIHTFLRVEQRGGKASAANLALQFAKGKYIVHLDADCSFDRDAIETILIPFFMDDKVAAVGGNVKVRNVKESLATRLQAIEYLKTVSVGRIITSWLGIYKIISGAFGAFRADIMHQLGGWDIGPGLDGDITVKIRKLGYKTKFEHRAVCLTAVPGTFKKLRKQRLRWDKSIIRFRIRKHGDIFLPHAHFNWSNFFASFENVFYNVILDITWIVYLVDVLLNYTSQLGYILAMNATLYFSMSLLQMIPILLFSERRNEEYYLLRYVPFMTFYTGLFLRLTRTTAYYQEFFFKRSYEDAWNPLKSSLKAKKAGM